MAMKPTAPKPMGSGKKNQPTKPRGVKLPGTPVPMPQRNSGSNSKPGSKPVPMPQKEGNYGKPRAQQTRPKQMGPAGPKKKSLTFKFATPKKKK